MEKIIMNKENIKIGNIWIEDSESIYKKYFLLASILVLSFLLSVMHIYLLMITIIIYLVIFIYIICNNRRIILSLDNTMIIIHYRTNVCFSNDISSYTEVFNLLKQCYENEDLNQKLQKYKIKDTIYLYNQNAEKAKEWFEEQNKKNKIII